MLVLNENNLKHLAEHSNCLEELLLQKKPVFLHGLGRGFVERIDYNDNKENLESCFFILNKDLFIAYVDPSDGYRSYTNFIKIKLEKLNKKEKTQLNLFEPLLVKIAKIEAPPEMKQYDLFKDADISGISIYCAHYKEEILKAGTEYFDEYYPGAIFSLNIELLQKSVAINLANKISTNLKNKTQTNIKKL